jgi:hypothetical protein
MLHAMRGRGRYPWPVRASIARVPVIMRRLSNTKLNAITLYLNFIVLAVIGLVSNPLLVRFLGVEAFGI